MVVVADCTLCFLERWTKIWMYLTNVGGIIRAASSKVGAWGGELFSQAPTCLKPDGWQGEAPPNIDIPVWCPWHDITQKWHHHVEDIAWGYSDLGVKLWFHTSFTKPEHPWMASLMWWCHFPMTSLHCGHSTLFQKGTSYPLSVLQRNLRTLGIILHCGENP